MNRRNAILIVVDRLGANYLGPYGNTWVETPAFNRLATQSLLWEQMIGTKPTLAGLYHSISTGRHPLVAGHESAPSLWTELQGRGIQTALLTDEPMLSQFPILNGFEDRIEQPAESSSRTATSLEQTQLFQTFVAALDWLTRPRGPFCLVLHARGMSAPWDAPREYRERFADDEDPPVPGFTDPPHRSLGQDIDPDEMWGMAQAYAGQVALLDVCLEMFLDGLAEHGLLENTLVMLTSPRGYPLGEHGHVGERGDLLYEETLHVPLLIRNPDQQFAMVRCQELAEPADLQATFRAWFELGPAASNSHAMSLLTPRSREASGRRDGVLSILDRDRSLRTPAWFWRQTLEQPPQLYAKPDDRWEVNEVAARCANVTEELAEWFTVYEGVLSAGQAEVLPRLPDHLLKRTD